MDDDISYTSNAASAALVPSSEGRPSLDGVFIDAETTTQVKREPIDLGRPIDFKAKKANSKLAVPPE